MPVRTPVWLWRALWAASIVTGLALFVVYTRIPVDGATGDLESFQREGFRIHRILEPGNGLQVGDIILRAGGYAVDEWLSGAPRGPEWRTGGTVTYEILRDGQFEVLQVDLAPLSIETMLMTWAPQLVVAVAFFSVGTFVFWRRPRELPARLLMLFGVSVALQYWGDAYNFQYSTIALRWPLWMQTVYEHVTYSLSIATICLFALVFPEPPPAVRRHPVRTVLLVFGPHLILIGGVMALSGSWTDALRNGSHVSWALALAQVFVIMVAGTRSYLTARDPTHRAQLRWIMWTAVIGAAVAIPGYVLPLLMTGRPILSHPLLMLGLAVLPVVLAVVILRYRLFEIDVLVRRTLVYGTIVVLLGAMYLVLIQVLTLMLGIVLHRQQDLLVSFAATICLVLLFNPLRDRVRTAIDRLIYRTVDHETLMARMSDALAGSLVLDDLTALLTQELPDVLQCARADLLVLDLQAEHLVPVRAGHLPELPTTHPVAGYARRQVGPIVAHSLPASLPDDVATVLDKYDVRVLVPFTVGGELIGLYALGPKLSGGAYTRRDVHLLHILGQQAAVAVQNARLYRQIEAYSRSLEEQVVERTQQLGDAYSNLTQQHTTLNIVLNNIADGLVVTDVEGQILMHNPVFLEMVAGLPSDCLEEPCIIDEDQPDLVGRLLRQVSPDPSLADTVSQSLQFPAAVMSVDSTWDQKIYRASSCALRSVDQPPSGVVTVLRDITQEVQMARMKDEFVSLVSHELRTPLTSIIGFTHLIDRHFRNRLLPHLADDDREAQRAAERILGNIEIIVNQGDRLTRMINNILDLSRMEAGHMQWDMEHLDIEQVIAESVDATQSLTDEKEVQVLVHVEEGLPPVYGDRDRIVQVVTNLLSNAFKFIDRGEIRVRAWKLSPGDDIEPLSARDPNVHLDLPARETCIVVSVQDSGTGIAETDLPFVFERFRQVGDQVTGTKRPGTGLGLPICQEIVEHHGGQIWVESRLGAGSRFLFTLRTAHPFVT